MTPPVVLDVTRRNVLFEIAVELDVQPSCVALTFVQAVVRTYNTGLSETMVLMYFLLSLLLI